MAVDDSVVKWLTLLRQGDPAAAKALWDRYFAPMTDLARARLDGATRRVADENDVALSAYFSFCTGMKKGKFPDLADGNSLWKLLVVITVRKAIATVMKEKRQRRGGGRRIGESAYDIALALDAQPTPATMAAVSDEINMLLNRLDDPLLRQVRMLKLEGYQNEEIARKLGCVPRTVERKLQRIRAKWEKESDGADEP